MGLPATCGEALSGLHCVIVTDMAARKNSSVVAIADADTKIKRKREKDAHEKEMAQAEAVYLMRLEGKTYSEIAIAMGMARSEAASLNHKHVDRLRELDALGFAANSSRLQDDRYEALLQQVWAQAMTGDLAAVRECRQILDSISARQDRFTALITKRNEDGGEVTLIASGSTEQYVQALRSMDA